MAIGGTRLGDHGGDAPSDDGAGMRDGDAEVVVDPWDYVPPQVTYDPIEEFVTTVLPTGEHKSEKKVVGYAVNPKFGADWEEIQTLQHFAALIEHRTGHKIRVIKSVHQSPDYDDLPELFEVKTAHCIGGPAPYEVAYAWMSGYENGIHSVLWKASNQ